MVRAPVLLKHLGWLPYCLSCLCLGNTFEVIAQCSSVSWLPHFQTPPGAPLNMCLSGCAESAIGPFVMFRSKTSHYASDYLTAHLEACDLGGETQVFGVYSGLSLSCTALNVVHVCSSLSHVFPHWYGNVVWAAPAWAGVSSFLPALGTGASQPYIFPPFIPSCQSWVPEWTLLNESSTAGRFWTLK